LAVDGHFEMVFMTYKTGGARPLVDYEFGLAASDDGITWVEDEEHNPILESAKAGWHAIYLSTLVQVGDADYLYFDVQAGIKATTSVWLLAENDP
jgi:hypothetical protein